MPRPSYTEDELRAAVAANLSMAGTLRALGLAPRGGNYATTRRRIRELGLDTSHWTGQGHLKGKTHEWGRARPLEEILVKDSDFRSNTQLKKRLIRAGLLVDRCATDGCLFHDGPLIYLGEPVVLHLDHINGDSRDHRIENLRLLCPLCHSQTDTYTGRNWGRYPRGKRKCIDCGSSTTSTSRCPPCLRRLRGPKGRCVDCGEEADRKRRRCLSCHLRHLATRTRPRKKTAAPASHCCDCGTSISRRATRCIRCAHVRTHRVQWPDAAELAKRVQATTCSAVARELGVSDNAVRRRLERAGYSLRALRREAPVSQP